MNTINVVCPIFNSCSLTPPV